MTPGQIASTIGSIRDTTIQNGVQGVKVYKRGAGFLAEYDGPIHPDVVRYIVNVAVPNGASVMVGRCEGGPAPRDDWASHTYVYCPAVEMAFIAIDIRIVGAALASQSRGDFDEIMPLIAAAVADEGCR